MNKSIYNDGPEYAAYYFDLIETDDLFLEFDKSKELTIGTFRQLTPELGNYSYAPNKWTIKDVIRHIINMERIFASRAFRFSRFDKTKLPGVEENDYASNVDMTDITLSDLQEEYKVVRKATVFIFKNATPEMLDFRGTANNQTYTARTCGFAMIGHNIHHCNVIRTKYLGF